MRRERNKNRLRAEYDLESMPRGVRGRYAKAFRSGTNIAVLEDDVASAFPTDESVNRALRTILEVAAGMPRKARSSKAVRRPASKPRRKIVAKKHRSGGR